MLEVLQGEVERGCTHLPLLVRDQLGHAGLSGRIALGLLFHEVQRGRTEGTDPELVGQNGGRLDFRGFLNKIEKLLRAADIN